MIHLLLSLICICAFLAVAAGMSQVGRDLITGRGTSGRHGPSGLSQSDDKALSEEAGPDQLTDSGISILKPY